MGVRIKVIHLGDTCGLAHVEQGGSHVLITAENTVDASHTWHCGFPTPHLQEMQERQGRLCSMAAGSRAG